MSALKNGSGLILEFKTSYSPPKSTSINLEFNTDFNPSGLRLVGVGNTLTVGHHAIGLKQQFIKPTSHHFSVFGSARIDIDSLKIRPIGINSTTQVGTPKYVSWRKQVQPSSIAEPAILAMVSRVRALGGYVAPHGSNINLAWFNELYTPPHASNVNLNFGKLGYNNISASLGAQTGFGVANIGQQLQIKPTGYIATHISEPTAYTEKGGIQPYSWSSNIFGWPLLHNNARRYQLSGFIASQFGTTTVDLHKRFILAKSTNDSIVSDQAFILGGKRYLEVKGFDVVAFGEMFALNTRASQIIKPSAIDKIEVPSPRVSPLIIFQKSFISTIFGNNLVQRNPSPLGFINTDYGQAWVSLGYRHLIVMGLDAFSEGYPRIADKTRRIRQQLTPIAGGIFGDTAVKNKNKKIDVEGFESGYVGTWGFAESNLKTIVGKTDNYFTVFGENKIFNKTPSIQPITLSHGAMFGLVGIDFFNRSLQVAGFNRHIFGKTTVSKPPEIKPKGLEFLEIGEHWVSHAVRTIEASGVNTASITNVVIWHKVRTILGIGQIAPIVGSSPIVEHAIRHASIQGYIASFYGQSSIDYRVRDIHPQSIETITHSNHKIATTQFIELKGFIASEFGERITPGAQDVYSKGIFSEVGEPFVRLSYTYLKVRGFDTENTFLHGRWGTQKVWNKQQHIEMYYDPDSLLTPPKYNSKWLLIENRNKELTMYGYTLGFYGRPFVENKARPLMPVGKDCSEIGKHRVSHFVQRVACEPIEPAYISGWTHLYNNAVVVQADGFHSSIVGQPSVLNTRRFPKIEGFENSIFGYPLIADRIREITFESRYGIAPPRIELPVVDLHSRYVDVASGIHKPSFGLAELNTYRLKMITRWSHIELAGTPEVRNLTPEVKVRGGSLYEFGIAHVRSSRSYHDVNGYIATLISKHLVEFRTRKVDVKGMQMMNVSQRHKLVRIGSTPYGQQYIRLDVEGFKDELNGIPNDGYGIGIPGTPYMGGPAPIEQQVPRPKFNRNVVTHVTLKDTAKFGSTVVSANTIRIDAGIQEHIVGDHVVGLYNRRLFPTSISSNVKYGIPRLSPHTIWAVHEAPKQAKDNHKEGGQTHYISTGMVVGSPKIDFYHRTLYIEGKNQLNIGSPILALKKHYIQLDGLNSLRFGWHTVPEWVRSIELFDSPDSAVFGKAAVAIKVSKIYQEIKPLSILNDTFPIPSVDYFDREIMLSGFDAMRLGSSMSPEKEYYPQHLYVGYPKPVRMIGFNAELFGGGSVSHKVRELLVVGFDAFVCTYSIDKYKDRLKIVREKLKPPTYQIIPVESTVMAQMGTADIKLKAHYIRPDGNSDQYRKGAPK